MFLQSACEDSEVLNFKQCIMAAVTTNYTDHAPEVSTNRVDRVISILRWTYGLVPIAAGADTKWE